MKRTMSVGRSLAFVFIVLLGFAGPCLAADQQTVLVVAQDGSEIVYHRNGQPVDMEDIPKGTELTIESTSGERCFVTYKGKPAYIRRQFLVTKQEFLEAQQRPASHAEAAPSLKSGEPSVTATSSVIVDSDLPLKTFATLKRQQTEEMAAKLHLDIPLEAREFFQAAEAGDYGAVSNRYARIGRDDRLLPGLQNVLFTPIQETFGAYEQFHFWTGRLLQKYANGILGSIPAGSIYFGGTDPGRFVITAVRDVAKSPDIFIVTQNRIGVDSHYMDYLRLLYGNRLWVPGEKDIQQAFQQSTEDVKSWNGVLGIIGKLTKMMFDNNKEQHACFVEESYVIPWMYPYMQPHGLILKLTNEPLTQLDPAVVARDRLFWGALTKELLADPEFLGNESARMTYAKLRSATGGLYAYRQLTSEAEAAFKQARQLGPMSPEATFRLAQLYATTGRVPDAITLLEQFKERPDVSDSVKQRVLQAITQLRDLKRQTDEKQLKTGPPSQPPGS